MAPPHIAAVSAARMYNEANNGHMCVHAAHIRLRPFIFWTHVSCEVSRVARTTSSSAAEDAELHGTELTVRKIEKNVCAVTQTTCNLLEEKEWVFAHVARHVWSRHLARE